MAWNNKEEWSRVSPLLSFEEQTVVVYDLETTGLSPRNDRFIEFAASKFNVSPDNQWALVDKLAMLVNPQRPLSPKITEITGITDADLAGQITEDQAFGVISSFLDGAIIAGYNNTRFDNKFIDEYYARYGQVFAPKGNIDGYLLAKQSGLFTELENTKLATVAGYYGVEFTAHRAAGDVEATSEVIRILVQEYRDSETVAPDTTVKQNATVSKVAYWAGYKGFSRIYCETNAGSVYYDLRSGMWGGKNVDIQSLDMENIQEQALHLTNSANMEEFSRFKTTVTL